MSKTPTTRWWAGGTPVSETLARKDEGIAAGRPVLQPVDLMSGGAIALPSATDEAAEDRIVVLPRAGEHR